MAKRITNPPSLLHRTIGIFDKVEPIQIIVFVFLMSGAFHQVHTLYKIGYPYIRFFSSTQLLSDSISFSLIFILKIIIPFTFGGITSIIVYKIFNKKKEFIFKHSVYIMYSLCLVLASFTNFFNEIEDIVGLILAAYGYQLVTNIYGMTYIVKGIEIEIENSNGNIGWKIPLFVIMTFYMFLFTPIYNGYSMFLNSTLLNNEFENLDRIHNIYKAKGVRDSVLYFNDKYIFVELKKDSIYSDKKNHKKLWKKQIRKIEILKFDKFFE